MALIVDKMAQRYGKLPSEILSTANTTDLRIMDITESYYEYRRSLAKGQKPAPANVTQDHLEKALQIAKEVGEKRAKRKNENKL